MKRILFEILMLVGMLILFSTTAMAERKWYNPLECDTPYVNGRAWNMEIGKTYHRFPDRFEKVMPKGVWGLSKMSAGLSVRFTTTAKNIQIKYVLAGNMYSYINMAILCHSGIDLYATDANGATHWIGNHMNWNLGKTAGDTTTIFYPEISIPSYSNRGLEYEVYLPPYNTVTYLSIGVPQDASFSFVRQSAEKPIVIYGTSIVQGASPSRPGLMWTTMVKRDLDYPVVNLGFSGSALMEPELFDAMSEIDARLFILDPLPNSFGLGDEIVKRAMTGIKKIRAKSDAPILMVDMYPTPDSVYKRALYEQEYQGCVKFQQAYEQLQKEGVKNLYYLYRDEIKFSEDAMIEGTHPNDIGNMQYAQAYTKKIREILAEDVVNTRYLPVRQRRDETYEWMNRHNEVIRMNHETNPEILMIGNSITQYWGGQPTSLQYGANSWGKLFGKRQVTNMGFGWDRIENIYWRIFHGELDGCHPKHICLSVGINNENDDVEDIANGVVGLAKLIRVRQPQAKLHVIKIYPAKNREDKIKAINDLIEQKLPIDNLTDLVDASSAVTLPDGSGKIDSSCFLDGVHPNEKGYALIADVLKNVLK